MFAPLVLCLLVPPPGLGQADAVPPDWRERAAAGLEGMRESLTAYAVDVRQTGRRRTKIGAPLFPIREKITYAKDRLGRIRISRLGVRPRSVGDLTMIPQTVESAYDGETYRNLHGADRLTFGTVSDRASTLKAGVDLGDHLYEYFNQPIAEWLLKPRGEEAFVRRRPNGDLEVRQPVRVTDAGVGYAWRFVLRPSARYFPVERAAQISYPRRPGRWHDYTRISTDQLETLADGAVVPTTATLTSYFTTAETAESGGDFPIAWERRVEFFDWRVAPTFPEGHFDLEFGPGVDVRDEIAGRTYRTGGPGREGAGRSGTD